MDAIDEGAPTPVGGLASVMDDVGADEPEQLYFRDKLGSHIGTLSPA